MKNKKVLIALIALVLVAAALVTVYFLTRPAADGGSKTVTVQIKYDDVDKEVVLHTDAEFLSGALLEKKLIEGTDTEYGLFITTVDGRAADDAAHEFWGIYKNGEMTPTGADSTAISDGEHYELILGTW
ncbi:MAG: DUF4430 domain-containing protein [Oscillospiraceae bacterium]|nr:DUF4430 domain-containing protein [Oscillospiraceae bacterium]MBQ3985360.1 DUF4430 domain-containing protein [Oscillospiraceae bacterium]